MRERSGRQLLACREDPERTCGEEEAFGQGQGVQGSELGVSGGTEMIRMARDTGAVPGSKVLALPLSLSHSCLVMLAPKWERPPDADGRPQTGFTAGLASVFELLSSQESSFCLSESGFAGVKVGRGGEGS